MENTINEYTSSDIRKICQRYQQERVGGQWYITQTGLNKVAKLIGGNYKGLTKNQKKQFKLYNNRKKIH